MGAVGRIKEYARGIATRIGSAYRQQERRQSDHEASDSRLKNPRGEYAISDWFGHPMFEESARESAEAIRLGLYPINHMTESGGTFYFGNGKPVPEDLATQLHLMYDRNPLSPTHTAVLGRIPTVALDRPRTARTEREALRQVA